MTSTYACQTVGDLTALLALLPSDMKVRVEVKTDVRPGGVHSLAGDLRHIEVCRAHDSDDTMEPGCVILTGK